MKKLNIKNTSLILVDKICNLSLECYEVHNMESFLECYEIHNIYWSLNREFDERKFNLYVHKIVFIKSFKKKTLSKTPLHAFFKLMN